MKKICIVTGTRAEYGLLRPVIAKISEDKDLQLSIAATGMHLSLEFGLTYREIEEDGFIIDEKIPILEGDDSRTAISKNIGTAIIKFADYFKNKRPDMLLILGDRYEIFAAATSAAVANIPIAHIYGGDTTEGATDEFFRHSITKMSYLHFASCEESEKRIHQLGENPSRVFNVGSLGVENLMMINLLKKPELESAINFNLGEKFALVTFHPVTLENSTSKVQFQELLAALDYFEDMKFIFTKANADADGKIINQLIDKYADQNKIKAIAFESMGVLRYLSAMKYAAMVIGNSSSGIYEAPSFKIPTINIGDRQKGRTQADSVINCYPNRDSIIKAINLGLKRDTSMTINPYYSPNTSHNIVSIVKEVLHKDNIDLKKTFYTI